MARIAAALAALSAGLVLAAPSQGAAPAGGLFGVVTRSPVTPTCVAEMPCSKPASGAVLVFSREGAEVARVKTLRNGTYRIHLAAGVYGVRCSVRRLDPNRVRVRAGTMRRVDFSIDTGIR
jgi:hypothetical protein